MLDTTSEAGSRAEDRLRSEEIAWLTTVRLDGQPQSVPVRFLWDGKVPRLLQARRPEAAERRGEPEDKPEPQLQ
jgi:hypothetical protein